MKLVAFLLIVAIHVNARGFSQITLSEKNASLEKVFKVIERQSGYVFFYDYAWLQQAKTINIKVKNASLSEVLNICFKDQPLTYSIVGKTVVVKPKDEIVNEKPVIQEVIKSIIITGTVTDVVTNSPLSGASIKLKGSDVGTSTDASGNFTLQVPDAGGVLVISYVGYEPIEMSVSKAGNLKISLKQKDAKIEEVVVIAYGNRQKRDLTGAYGSVGEKEISKSTSPSPEMALQGRLAGVQVISPGGNPNTRTNVRIRGVTTITNSSDYNNEPLYVIDGVPITEGGIGNPDPVVRDVRTPNNPLALLNSNDIESITVLKDASAAALYGVRAGNGVILITTKRGKGKPRIEVNGFYGVQDAVAHGKQLLNTSQFVTLYNEAYLNNPSRTSGGAIRPIGEIFGRDVLEVL